MKYEENNNGVIILFLVMVLQCWSMTLKCQSFEALNFDNSFKTHEISGANPWLSSALTTNLTGDVTDQINFGMNVTQQIELEAVKIPVSVGIVNQLIEFSATPYLIINSTEVDMAILHGGVKAFLSPEREFKKAEYYLGVEYLRKLPTGRSVTISVGPYFSETVLINVTSVIPINNALGVLIDLKGRSVSAGVLLAKQF